MTVQPVRSLDARYYTDPAIFEMEKNGVISPTSDFRGNWDLVQAVLLFYIAGMLMWSNRPHQLFCS